MKPLLPDEKRESCKKCTKMSYFRRFWVKGGPVNNYGETIFRRKAIYLYRSMRRRGGGLPYVEQLDHFFSRVSSLWELKTCMSFLTPPRKKKKKKQIQEKNMKRYRVKETHSWRTINRYTARIMPHKKKSLGF